MGERWWVAHSLMSGWLLGGGRVISATDGDAQCHQGHASHAIAFLLGFVSVVRFRLCFCLHLRLRHSNCRAFAGFAGWFRSIPSFCVWWLWLCWCGGCVDLFFVNYVHRQDGEGATALAAASQSGHLNCVKKLLARSLAALDVGLNNHCTPLFLSAQEGHTSIAAALVQVG